MSVTELYLLELHRGTWEASRAELAERSKQLDVVLKRGLKEETEVLGKLKYANALSAEEKTALQQQAAKIRAGEEQTRNTLVSVTSELAGAEYTVENIRSAIEETIQAIKMSLGSGALTAPTTDSDSKQRKTGCVSSLRDALSKIAQELCDVSDLVLFVYDPLTQDIPHFAAWEQRTLNVCSAAKERVLAAHRNLLSVLNGVSEAFPALSADVKIWTNFVASVDAALKHCLLRSLENALSLLSKALSGSLLRELFAVNLKLGSNNRTAVVPSPAELPQLINNVLDKLFSIPNFNKFVELTSVPCEAQKGVTAGTIAAELRVAPQLKEFIERIKQRAASLPDDIVACVCKAEERFEYLWSPNASELNVIKLQVGLAEVEFQWVPRYSVGGAVLVNAFPLQDALVSMCVARIAQLKCAAIEASAKNIEKSIGDSTIAAIRAAPVPQVNPPLSARKVSGASPKKEHTPRQAVQEAPKHEPQSSQPPAAVKEQPKATPRGKPPLANGTTTAPRETEPTQPPQQARPQPQPQPQSRPVVVPLESPRPSTTPAGSTRASKSNDLVQPQRLPAISTPNKNPIPTSQSRAATSSQLSCRELDEPVGGPIDASLPPPKKVWGSPAKEGPSQQERQRTAVRAKPPEPEDSAEADELAQLIRREKESMERIRALREREEQKRKDQQKVRQDEQHRLAAERASAELAAQQRQQQQEQQRKLVDAERARRQQQFEAEMEAQQRARDEEARKLAEQKAEAERRRIEQEQQQLVEQEIQRRKAARAERARETSETTTNVTPSQEPNSAPAPQPQPPMQRQTSALRKKLHLPASQPTTPRTQEPQANPDAQPPRAASDVVGPPQERQQQPQSQPRAPRTAPEQPTQARQPQPQVETAPPAAHSQPELPKLQPLPQRSVAPAEPVTSTPAAAGEMSLHDEYKNYCSQSNIKPNSDLLKKLPREKGAFISEINLDLNYIGIKGVQPLLQILKRNRGLRLLNLKDNNLENDEVKSLASILLTESGAELTHLDLSNNPISLAGGSALMELVTRQKSLKTIVLRGTLIQPKVVDRIVEAAHGR